MKYGKTAVKKRLRELEKESGIRILLAAPRGSRAHGWQSRSSDYDVAFVYVRPERDYFRVHPAPESLQDHFGHIEMQGWDLRRALELLSRADVSVSECLTSRELYLERHPAERLRELLERTFCPVRLERQYLGKARSNEARYLRGERVICKKYLYVIQPLLCCRYLERFGTMPPSDFETLAEAVMPEEIRSGAMQIFRLKKQDRGGELLLPVPELHAFFRSEFERIEARLASLSEGPEPAQEELDELFFLGVKSAGERRNQSLTKRGNASEKEE